MFNISEEQLCKISGGQTCEVVMTATAESGFTSVNKDIGDCEKLQAQYDNGFYDKFGEKWINAGFDFTVVIKPVPSQTEL